MSDKYILTPEGEVIVCHDLLQWAKWYEENVRTTCWIKTTHIDDDTFVSTIFLAMNHDYFNQGFPKLWETMAFKDHEGLYQQRYVNKEVALVDHDRVVELLKGKQPLTYSDVVHDC